MKKQLLTEAGDDTARSTALAEACVPAFEILERAESPRFIKTHLPFSLLPQDLLQSGAKVFEVISYTWCFYIAQSYTGHRRT